MKIHLRSGRVAVADGRVAEEVRVCDAGTGLEAAELSEKQKAPSRRCGLGAERDGRDVSAGSEAHGHVGDEARRLAAFADG
jgi:hypothetical protein